MSRTPEGTSEEGVGAAAIVEMLSLFCMLCGLFLMLASAYFYIDITRSVHGAVLPAFSDIGKAISGAASGGLTDEDRAEFQEIAEESARLQEDLREAIADDDKNNIEYIRQQQNELAERERELVENIHSRGDDDMAPLREEVETRSEEIEKQTGNLREQMEVAYTLCLFGAPMFFLGGAAYRITRAMRREKALR
ncbi:MAG TPA: hypothetical protein PLW48_08820 [Alphaproteobacteria bacterium]|nr:hypothetical protein [Rhodospirillaceae bacterium]HRJ67225.1 hypothetical protein [Alphaproteobacteria bacterium]